MSRSFNNLFKVKDNDTISLPIDGSVTNIKVTKNFTGGSGDVTFLINDGKHILKIFKNMNTTEIENTKLLSTILKKNAPKLLSSGTIKFNDIKHAYFIMEAIKPIIVKNVKINSLKDLIILYCQKKEILLEIFLLEIFWQLFLLIEILFFKNIYHCDLHDQNILITEIKNDKNDKNSIIYNGKNYKIVIIDVGMLGENICPKHDRKFSSSLLKTSSKCSSLSFKYAFQTDKTYFHIKDMMKDYYKIDIKEYSDWFFFLNLICASSVVNFPKLLETFEQNTDLDFKQIIHFLLFRSICLT